MKYSQALVALVKEFEGCSLQAYKDAGGWSIGYGHFGVKEGDTITQEEAESLLLTDLLKVSLAVDEMTQGRELRQGQFDALCDFAYNLGIATLHHSVVLACVLNHKDDTALAHLMLYVYSGGAILQSLVKRRHEEFNMYQGIGL